MKVTFEFDQPNELIDLFGVLVKSVIDRLDPELGVDENNIYTVDEMNDILIDSDGIGAP